VWALMNVPTKAIVSNSDMIKFYKLCRDKAECFGKIFVFKNNQPDAVLFSIAEYERLSPFFEPPAAMKKTCGVEAKNSVQVVLPVE